MLRLPFCSALKNGNYYNITVKGREYKFYIMKAPAEDLVVPTYLGKDIVTDITVTTEKSSLSLMTLQM